MSALFGPFLFWIGVPIFYVGIAIMPWVATTRERAVTYFVACLFGGGIVCMGTAVTDLGYVPPEAMTSRASAAVAWTALIIGFIACCRGQWNITRREEGHEPPEE